VVELGDTVEEGALVACIPEGALSANIHASIGGTVVEVNANQIVIQA
jgi:Na+-translocating ferredoxin:NAD+ oxidoreductase RnfC subunit